MIGPYNLGKRRVDAGGSGDGLFCGRVEEVVGEEDGDEERRPRAMRERCLECS